MQVIDCINKDSLDYSDGRIVMRHSNLIKYCNDNDSHIEVICYPLYRGLGYSLFFALLALKIAEKI
jgi:hypothetical protein